MSMNFNSLTSQMKKPLPGGVVLRQGEVTAVNSGQTIDVKIAGDDFSLPSVKYLESFFPVIGMQVWLLTFGADILGIGKIAVDGSGAPTIASANTIAPTTERFFVSGTTTIKTITPPSWIESNPQITVIPLGLFVTDATGNIALASTAVIGRAIIFTWDAGTALWYPNS